jgi:AMP phosphorylase
MKLKVKVLELLAGRPVAILNRKTATKLGAHVDERIIIKNRKSRKKLISIIDIAQGLVNENELVVSNEIQEQLNLRKGQLVNVEIAPEPKSIAYIYKKLNNKRLSKQEIKTIISDIVKNALTETEIAYFVSAVHNSGMNSNETEALIKSMVNVGQKLSFKGKVVDKHCIGGIAGNRTTPLVVSICAAAGLTMPKTSSRAITSAAGTADVTESIANIEFSVKEIKQIIKKTNACLAWNGILGLSPADDKLIQVEKLLHLDPEPQLLASILSKKLAVGSKYVLIDIPYGKGAKVSKKRAKELKKKFEKFGTKLGLKIKVVLTKGNEPIGNGIGPLQEIQDILKILKRDKDAPKDLEKKSVFLSAQLLELSGKANVKNSNLMAQEILDSGKALAKFKQIITAQKGKIPKTFPKAKLQYIIKATHNGKIKCINNKLINQLAIIAGSPQDKQAGLYLHHHIRTKLKKSQPLITIYSNSKTRLKDAKQFSKENKIIRY